MKLVLTAILLGIMAVTIFSCKKSSDDNPNNAVNWKEALKGTVWSGEYKYTIGTFQGLQPYSMEINSDGTVTWADEGSIRDAGTWKVNADTIKLTFPNQTTFTATPGKDKWSNFSNQESNGFKIENISAATPVREPDIVNLTFDGVSNGMLLRIKFLPGNAIQISGQGLLTYILPYKIAGAGIRAENRLIPNTAINYFMIFQSNMTTLNGFNKEYYSAPAGVTTSYYTWKAYKQ